MTESPKKIYKRGFRLTTSSTLLLCLGFIQWPFMRPVTVLAATNTCLIPTNQGPSNQLPLPPNGVTLPQPQIPINDRRQSPLPASNDRRQSPLPAIERPSNTKSGIPKNIQGLDKNNAIAHPDGEPDGRPDGVPPLSKGGLGGVKAIVHPDGGPDGEPNGKPPKGGPGGVLHLAQRSGRLGRYRLGPGDQLFIDVQPFVEYSQQTIINPEGLVVIPLLGAIPLQGLTPAQAQAQIQRGLNQFLVNPVVSLQLLVPRPLNVTITGEVARPGFYPVAAQAATLATLLSTAGGVSQDADLRQVILRWTELDGTTREQTIDLLTPLTQGQPLPNVSLEDGDAIVVPKRALGQEERVDRNLIGRSTLVSPPAPVEITVLGEVGQPGFYILPPSVRPLADALLIAGGASPSADLRRLMVRRLQDNGTLAEPIVLDIYDALQTNGETLPDFPLGNGDVVIVPKLPLADPNYDNNLARRSNIAGQQPVQINILGEVTQPGYHILPASVRPLPDALLIAGGASPAADLQNIQVRRLLGDGTVSEETVDLYTPLINGEELPSVRLGEGDVVIVPKRAIANNQDYDNNLVGQWNVAAQQPVQISVLGEVAQPGFHILPASLRPLPDALLIAGGASPAADLRSVQVQRLLGDGRISEETIDLYTPLINGEELPSIRLSSGDVVIVPKRALGDDRDYDNNLVAQSNVAAQQPVQITVVGEVTQPGFHILPASLRPLPDALLIAGGASPAADLQNIQVCRLLDDGTISKEIIDLYTPLINGQELPSIRLSSGDVVIVPKRAIANNEDYDNNLVGQSNVAAQQPVQITVLGEVAQPGFHILPASLRPLPDALLIAGGASPSADLQNIQVRRLLGDGTTSEETIDLFTPLINGEELPSIRLSSGDIVFIPKRALGDDQDYDNNLVGQSNVAAQQPVQITVLGEVAQPGFHVLNPAPRPLANALLTAGGTRTDADLRSVRVRRLMSDGNISEEVVDLFTPLQTGGELPSLRLGNGDVVFVPKLEPGTDEDYDRLLIGRSTLANPEITIRILSYPGEGANLVTLRNGSTFSEILNTIPLSQADLRDIAVIRFDPEQGRAVTRKVDVKKLLEGDNSQNIPLQNNDVVVIGRNLLAKLTYSLSTFTQPFRDVLGFLLFFDQLRDSADALFGPGTNNN